MVTEVCYKNINSEISYKICHKNSYKIVLLSSFLLNQIIQEVAIYFVKFAIKIAIKIWLVLKFAIKIIRKKCCLIVSYYIIIQETAINCVKFAIKIAIKIS